MFCNYDFGKLINKVTMKKILNIVEQVFISD